MNRNNFYVYVYLDPQKSGNFIYEEFSFNNEPIYIGKGTGNRLKYHLRNYKYNKTYFYSKISSIINNGYDPLYHIVIDNLTEDEANYHEKRLIKLIGRKYNGGPLTNLSDGGEGQTGFKHREESKLKTSNSLKNNIEFQNYMKTEEYRSKISKSLMGHPGYGKGIPRTEDVKNKLKDSCSMVINIKCPDGNILEFIGTLNVFKYFNEKNLGHKKYSNKRISTEGILYGNGSKGYQLISKITKGKLNKIIDKKIDN